MNFDISNRDQYGFLRGSFSQGWLVAPIKVSESIRPFLFPCQACRRLAFHVAAEQHAGLYVKLPFTSDPLASTGKSYMALCNTCTTINTHLPEPLAKRMRMRVLPTQVCNLYTQVCGQGEPRPYSEEFIKGWVEGIPEDRSDLRKCVSLVLRAYALETDAASMRQTLCGACGVRITPIRTANSFLARTFRDKPDFDYHCPLCNHEVWPPATG
jgi:hypothetical protein